MLCSNNNLYKYSNLNQLLLISLNLLIISQMIQFLMLQPHDHLLSSTEKHFICSVIKFWVLQWSFSTSWCLYVEKRRMWRSCRNFIAKLMVSLRTILLILVSVRLQVRFLSMENHQVKVCTMRQDEKMLNILKCASM